MATKKQTQRRESKSQLGFTDIKKAVAISRLLQQKILLLLESPETPSITPAQIQAVSSYLSSNGLSMAPMMVERNKRQVEAGDGVSDDDIEEDLKEAKDDGSSLPFKDGKPNPLFKPTEQATRTPDKPFRWNESSDQLV